MRVNAEASMLVGGSECSNHYGSAKPKLTLDDFARAGIPTAISGWLVSRLGSCQDDPHVQRGRRLVEYARRGDAEERELSAAWSKLARAAHSNDDLVALFAAFPDGPDAEPYARVVGKRNVDAGEERRRYRDKAKHARALRRLLEPASLKRIAADAQATGSAAVELYQDIAGRRLELMPAIFDLAALLDSLDPSAKVPTKHHTSAAIGVTNYRNQLAQLNRFLTSNQHAAIVTIARANYPAYRIKRSALSKICGRGDKAAQVK